MSLNPEIKTVWDWLIEQGYRYDIVRSGWESPCEIFFFSDRTLFLLPGDVIFFLRTGHVRNKNILTSELRKNTAFHRDGTCVEMRRIK